MALKNSEALEMLKDIVNEIDYDVYKQLFVEDCMEDPEASFERQQALMDIVGKHIKLS